MINIEPSHWKALVSNNKAGLMIQTRQLMLRIWHDGHRQAFAQMHADPVVMADQGGTIGRTQSDAKFDRYSQAYMEHGMSRWAIEAADGAFLGYAGVMPEPVPDHPLGSHFQIGWRFVRSAWGHGYATESATAALTDAFQRLGLKEIASYTSADNRRSQAVMMRLGLRREPSCDFIAHYEGVGSWRGLVWKAFSADWSNTSAL